MATKSKSIIEASALILAGAITIACYIPSFSGAWNLDDFQHIVNNPAVHVTELNQTSLSRAITESYLKNRPLSYLSFALDYYIAGLDLWQYHLTNLILHLICSFLVWAVLRALFLSTPLAANIKQPRTTALVCFFVFAIHPLQTQSVTYIVQRMNVLAALFAFAALYAWLQIKVDANNSSYTKGHWKAAVIICTGLGLAAKENALSIVLLVLAMDRCLSPWNFLNWLAIRWRCLLLLMSVALVITAIFYYGADGLLSGYNKRDFTMVQRILTQPRVIMLYVQLALWPVNKYLNINHDILISTGLFWPITTLPALIVIIGLSLVSFLLAERAPLLALGWLWFITGLALESSVLPLEMTFEHRMYLPLVGLIMIAADLAGRFKLDYRSLAPLGLLLVFFGVSTFLRNEEWKSYSGLWRDAVKKAPLAARPWQNLCAGALDMPEPNYGYFWCRRAVTLSPKNGGAWYNFGVELMRRQRWEEAEKALRKSLEYDPAWADAYYQLGRLQIQRRADKDALSNFKAAVKLEPDDPIYWYQLGTLQVSLGDKEPGCNSLRQALVLSKGGPPGLRVELENSINYHYCSQ